MAILSGSFEGQLDSRPLKNEKANAYRVSLSDIVRVWGVL